MAVNVDIFELEDSHQKGVLALYMEAACKLASCSCFLEGNLRQRVGPRGSTLISLAAMSRYLQQQARDAVSRARHTTLRETIYLSPGTWVLCFRRGKVTRGHVEALFELGLWLGPTRVIMTERVQQWSG